MLHMSVIMSQFNIKSVLATSLISPSLFFLISNFGVWLTGSMYALNTKGLIACYVAGIPFFDESLWSTLLFSITIFMMMKLIVKKPEELVLVKK